MLAWRVHEFGPPESMRLERVPIPHPGSGEVLVKVSAAGVGPWDAWIRSGKSALLQTLPLVLGSDISGVIQALGPDVPDLRVGDEVYGVTNPQFTGGYAEYAVASARMIARKPISLSPDVLVFASSRHAAVTISTTFAAWARKRSTTHANLSRATCEAWTRFWTS
jgi:NADPH:quinone reductase-like Zn-dependent oxidoreductase